MLRFDPISYKRNVSNYLANCLRNDQYEEFERVIVQLRSNTPFKNARDRAWELENVDYLSFMFSFRRLEFVNAKQKLEAMAIKLKAVRQFIEPLIELNLYYNFGLFCFFNQNLDESRQWFSHLQTTKLPLAGRLRNIAPLFESIIYCEDPDFDYETRLRVLNRHQRYYKDKEPDFPQGLPLLQILLKYAGAILPAEKKKHLKQFASKIDELPGHPGLEEMQLWAQSKVAKRPVFEILVETREAEMKQISSRT